MSADTARFVGTWQGTLAVGQADLRVVFRLRWADGGGLTGSMDSPDQGATDIPLGRVLTTADTLRLWVPSIAGTYAGILRDSARTLEGAWRQGGTALPLTLSRTPEPPTVRRPQTPEPPYPYDTEKIAFRNQEAGLTLEGGRIAPIVAAQTDRVAFLVLPAAPGLSGRDLLAAQLRRRTRRQGVDRRTQAIQQGTQQRLFQTLAQNADSATIAGQLRRIMQEAKGIRGEQTIAREVKRLMDPWFRFYLTHDPRSTLKNVDVPVLSLAGSLDQQMDPDTNQAAIREALRAGGNARVTTRTLDRLNHHFQPVPPGRDPQAYGRIRTTFAPVAIDRMVAWIDEQVGLPTP